MVARSKKVKIRLLKDKEREESFSEVVLGYNHEEAYEEAARCLQCKNKPCVEDCPVKIDIPEFIKEIISNNLEKALQIINANNSFPGICGRVCPQEAQCQTNCIRARIGDPIEIGELERYVADSMADSTKEIKPIKKVTDVSVAVIGSGPASLACAGELLKNGINVTLYEALHELGGVLRYGIPEFRLPREVIDREIEFLIDCGLIIERNFLVGRTIELDELLNEGFNFVFVGIGAGTPRLLNIAGENFNGVYSANEFLTRVNLMKAYDHNSDTPIYVGNDVIVIGGGNVALDAARSARRLTKGNVTIVYRRSMEEIPARKAEIQHALDERIDIKTLLSPALINGKNGWALSLECDQMELTDDYIDGRKTVKKSILPNKELKADTIIVAIGQKPNSLIKNISKKLELTKRNTIRVNNRYETSLENVYAGGDIITGSSTVISAISAGRKAALEMLTKCNKISSS